MIKTQRQQNITFFLLLALVTVVVFLVWLPFLKLLALGIILAILFSPIHVFIKKKISGESWAAFLTLLLILLIIVVPLYLMGSTLLNEIGSLYQSYRQGGGAIDKSVIIESLPGSVRNIAVNIYDNIALQISNFAVNAFSGISGIFANVANFVVSLILVFFTAYYFLRDGYKIKAYFNSIFPLSPENENILTGKVEHAVNGIIKGSFLIALIQGAIATVGFLIFGVPSAFLWGAFTVLAALVPNFGTSLSIIPAVLYLFISGHIGSGIGMVIWGAIAVGTIDNIVSPKLIGSKATIHPLLILFSVIGGMNYFGALGFLLGPILTAVFLALLDIYRAELKIYLEEK